MLTVPDFASHCPIPIQQYPQILMAHGGGGRLMHQLIDQMFLAAFGSHPDWQHDAARLTMPGATLAFTTDSYVVSPLFFPGGDIGSMAVYGTVNDLAMAGAKPLYLSLSFILEEGLAMETLWQVVQSIQNAASVAGVRIVTGDTKVVDRGKGDGIYINTAGIGAIEYASSISPLSICPGDAILLNGDLGRHGVAIMAQREGLNFETMLKSDVASVSESVQALLNAEIEVHCLRDLTRGGLAIALNELASAGGLSFQIEDVIPLSDAVQGACEILGLDPLYLANEGRFVTFVPDHQAQAALKILQMHAPRGDAAISPVQIGTVEPKSLNVQGGAIAVGVKLRTSIGGNRILEYRNVDTLPRIC